MTARLRELAERWKGVPNVYGSAEETYRECANELLAILDAEGDDGAVVTELVCTAPEQIYLQISDEKLDHEESFPANYGDEITWCADSVLDCEVKYIRADLATRTHPARSGGVSDAEDAARYQWLRISACEIAWNEWCSYLPGYSANGPEELDQAIDAARKGERHE